MQKLPLIKQFRFKLIVAFFVPVIFIVALGLFSYQKSKGTIINNYEMATQGNVDNSSLYCALLMNDIETKTSQIAGNNEFIFYYVRYATNSIMDSNNYYNNSRNTMVTLVSNSVGIYNAYAFGDTGKPMTSLVNAPEDTLYDDFSASEEAVRWQESATESGGMQSAWMGHHDSIDLGTGSSSEYYAATFIRKFSRGEGYIVFDLLKTKVQEVLDNTIASDGSIAAFITADGRETLSGGNKKTVQKQSDGKTIISGYEFIKKAAAGEEERGFDYVTFKGETNLFVYSKIGDTGAMICSLTPKRDILNQLGTIRIATAIFVIVACVIAILIGLILSTDIARTIKKFSACFKQVSAGDFTTRVKTARKDEFGVLAEDMDDMLVKIRSLVSDMTSFGHSVSDAALKVSDASSAILTSINEVSEIVNVMGQGISEQQKDTENNYTQMTSFAGQIGEAYDDTKQVDSEAAATQQIIDDGKNYVDELMKQVTSTSEITNIIIKDIDELQMQSKSIGGIIGAINNIASTTQLLSLNASIEAARAGEFGRGFAVVAEQIRFLAEQSVASVKNIENIIRNIQSKTLATSSSASHAEQMLAKQSEALNNTVKVFHEVDDHMADLMDRMKHIMNNMLTITVSKDDILDSIRNIAAVTEETVAASEEVGATVYNQITSVETLNLQAEDMKKRSLELEAAIAKFTI